MNSSTNLYAEYHAWKSWDGLFVCTADQAGYFTTELADLKISDADVLEIGFGSGSCVAWMAKSGARLCVTEINERSCQAARDKGFDVLDMDIPSIAEDNTARFDSIIAFDVFEHLDLEDVARYCNACAIMLRPGGKLLLRFPNAQSPFGLKHQAGDPTHRSQLSQSVLKLLITPGPLRVVRYAGSHLYRGKPLTPVWAKRSLRRILQIALGRLLDFVYASGIPYEPVVVIVLQKDK